MKIGVRDGLEGPVVQADLDVAFIKGRLVVHIDEGDRITVLFIDTSDFRVLCMQAFEKANGGKE